MKKIFLTLIGILIPFIIFAQSVTYQGLTTAEEDSVKSFLSKGVYLTPDENKTTDLWKWLQSNVSIVKFVKKVDNAGSDVQVGYMKVFREIKVKSGGASDVSEPLTRIPVTEVAEVLLAVDGNIKRGIIFATLAVLKTGKFDEKNPEEFVRKMLIASNFYKLMSSASVISEQSIENQVFYTFFKKKGIEI